MRVAITYNINHEVVETSLISSNIHHVDKLGRIGTQVLFKPRHQEFDDEYAEWDSMETIEAMKAGLSLNHEVILIEADKDVTENLKLAKPDIVFNVAEGKNGVSRESQVPAICEMLNIPYTGSDPVTLGICLDKSRAKEILSYYKIPTANFRVINNFDDINLSPIILPSIIKPLHEGSSKGIYDSSLVQNEQQYRTESERILTLYHQPVLVEEFLSGREFTVSLCGNDDTVEIFPIVEINFDSLPKGVNPIYSYEAKWIWDQLENPLDIFRCPTKLSTRLQKQIETICLDTFAILKLKDWARIDVRCDGKNRPHIIEINPIPGILPNPDDHSCFPKAARAAGIGYDELLNKILNTALQRYSKLNA
ncbi:MAG: D-alanine--D-alanine ligase [Bacteroidetes bacterium]|nr:D-alanine--D-alanine ligase [Bacteroidota bacterium]